MSKSAVGPPTIIAVNHHPYTTENGLLKVKEFLERKAADGKKRTLFIELGKQHVLEIQKNRWVTLPYDPFIEAIWIAQRAGWNVEPLDRHKTPNNMFESPIYYKISKTIFESPIDWRLGRRYENQNLRENYWAKFLKKNAKPEDLVVMHPNHVRGFLISSGIKKENVFWADKPKKVVEGTGRLSPEECRMLKRQRDIARTIRKQIRRYAK